jgi:hypothetical protein
MKRACIIKLAILILTATAMLALSGCIKQKMVVKVKPDGTGNIIVSMMFDQNIVKSIEKQQEERRKQMEEKGMDDSMMAQMLKDPFFNEEQIKRGAKRFGENVEYVKAKKIKNASGRGYIAIYAFSNINDLKLDLAQLGSPMPQFGNQQPGDDSVSFVLTKGDVTKLKVTIPKAEKEATTEKIKEEEVVKPTPLGKREKAQMTSQGVMFGLTGKETTKEEVFRKMYGSMSITIDLEVVGKLIKSDATFKNPKKKNRCTLFVLDFNTLLESDKICSKVVNDQRGQEFLKEMITTKAKVKGLKIEEKSEITLEFKGK